MNMLMMIIKGWMKNQLILVSALDVLYIWVGSIYAGEFVFLDFAVLINVNSNEI